MTLLLLTLVNIFNYLDRILVQAVKPLLLSEWNLTEQQAGYLISALVVGYCLFAPIFGTLAGRYSRPRLMAVGIFLWSLATVLTGLAPSFYLFFLARVLVGVGEASFATICPGYLHDRIRDPVKFNSALAVFSAAIPVGSALGFVLGGEATKFFSWHAAFFVGGVPGFLLAYLVWRLPDARHETPGLETPPTFVEGLKALRKLPVFWFAVSGYVFNSFALSGVVAMIAKYGVDIGFTLHEIDKWFGIILVVTGFAGALGGGKLSSLLASRSSNPRRTLLLFTGMSALAGVPFLAIALSSTDHTTFLVMCFMAELAIFAGVAPINSVIVLAAPERYVTIAQGITIAALNIFGAFLSPIVLGAVADAYTLPFAMQLCTVSLALCGLLWIGGTKVDR